MRKQPPDDLLVLLVHRRQLIDEPDQRRIELLEHAWAQQPHVIRKRDSKSNDRYGHDTDNHVPTSHLCPPASHKLARWRLKERAVSLKHHE